MGNNKKTNACNKTACKICGSETRDLYDTQMKDRYHICPVCKYIFLDNGGYVSSEDEKERYLEHNNSYENEGYRSFLEGFLDEAVFPYGKNFDRALDFGSGPEPVLSRIMREKHGIKTDICDLYFSPEKVYLDNKYDLIVATEVFEHLKEPVDTIKELSKCLKTDGLLSVMTLFHYNDDESFLGWHYRRDKTHIGFFMSKTLEKLGELANLRLIHTDGKRCGTFKKYSDADSEIIDS
ncbi:MAG: class I SAM-dependent methyltransferase [Peptostreptococcaceae bacterium]|nr:class I SAM-dependent methyltransferase [Peptostreptococcaceae bacterium]